MRLLSAPSPVLVLALPLGVLCSLCGCPTAGPDAGPGSPDAGAADAGARLGDGGPGPDAGEPREDAGAHDGGSADGGPPRSHGLERREPNTTCALPGSPPTGVPALSAEPLPDAPALVDAVQVLPLPSSSKLLAALRGGAIVTFDIDGAGADLLLDLGARAEGGVLGVALHPSWPATPKLYAAFIAHSPRRLVLSSFEVDSDALVADPLSEVVLLEEAHASGPDGGAPLFGFDGMLYLPLGVGSDDGAASDRSARSGSVLRLDVDGVAPYVPADNPFANDAGAAPEVWAKGFRDPRCLLDSLVGRVLCLDRGVLSLEIDTLSGGADYGWPRMDGSTCVAPGDDACTDGSLRRPLLQQADGEACAPRAGVLYRGRELGELSSVLLFGSACGGTLHGVRFDGTNARADGPVLDLGEPLAGVFADAAGEPLVLAASGALFRLRRPAGEAPPVFPIALSDTGCFSDVVARAPAAGVIPYAVRAPLWSDGAGKERYFALPGEEKIGFTTTGAWQMPIGTLLIKTFLSPAASDPDTAAFPMETRFIVRRGADAWEGYSYMWTQDGSDALLLDGGERRGYELVSEEGGGTETHVHTFPSRSDCLLCHNAANGRALGLHTGRLNGDFDYGGFVDNQLAAMDHIGLFEPPLPAPPDELPRWPQLHDEDAPVSERARAYLAGNCAHCHLPGGPPQTFIDLRFETPFAQQRLCDEVPLYGDFGIPDARIIKPGERAGSELFFRVTQRGPGQMPPLATLLVDDEATAVIGQWIDGLASCP